MDSFYHGFCNGTLWPLFHYFPSYAIYNERDWETYRRVNEKFCEALMELVQPGDEIWVHDYQLLLLPALLRKRLTDASIGFFLHIPFPSFEVFRQLPTRWRRELLEGVLGADLMGFHTHDYAQHFLHSVFRTLGYEHYLGQINVGGVITGSRPSRSASNTIGFGRRPAAPRWPRRGRAWPADWPSGG
jgi:trehalose 6-phosphate synthase/phosphatase